MANLRKPVPVNDSEKTVVIHSSSAFRINQPNLPLTPPSPGIHVDLVESLQRHWLLAGLLFGIIVLAGALVSLKMIRPIYRAEATIFVPPDLAKVGPDGSDSSYGTLVNQQIMTILHYNTMTQAIERLKAQGVAWAFRGETERQAVDRLRSAVDVQRVPDSYEIVIQATARQPRSAALIANTIADTFLDQGSRPDATGQVDQATALSLAKVTLQKELEQRLQTRAKLATSLQVIDLHKETVLPDDDLLVQLHRNLAAAHRKRIEAEEQLAEGQTTVGVEAQQLANADTATRSLTTNLLQRQFELRQRIKDMLPSHPVRKEAEAEIARIDAELKNGPSNQVPKITANLMAKLRAEAEQSRRLEMTLTEEIARQTSSIPDATQNLGKAELVNGDIARIQDRLSHIEGEMEDLTIRSTSGDTMRVFSRAQVPSAPVRRQRSKALAIVIALAMLVGIGVPVGLDLADSRIYDPATVERILGFPVVGMAIHRTPKTEQFADEHLRRLVAGIERGIADGARTVLLVGLKEPVPPPLLNDIWRQLSEHKMNVSMSTDLRRDMRATSSQTKLIGPGVPATTDLENCEVALTEAPALVFSAQAERLAAEADMTLVIVEAGTNRQTDLVRGARLLERLNVPAVGVILHNVRIERAGRSLRRDFKEYTPLQSHLARFLGGGDRKAFV